MLWEPISPGVGVIYPPHSCFNFFTGAVCHGFILCHLTLIIFKAVTHDAHITFLCLPVFTDYLRTHTHPEPHAHTHMSTTYTHRRSLSHGDGNVQKNKRFQQHTSHLSACLHLQSPIHSLSSSY